MTNLLIIGGILVAATAMLFLMVPRYRNRPSAENNWKNEGFAARERGGSWTENEAWVGNDDHSRSNLFPGAD